MDRGCPADGVDLGQIGDRQQTHARAASKRERSSDGIDASDRVRTERPSIRRTSYIFFATVLNVIELKGIETMNDYTIDGLGHARPSWRIPVLLLALLLGLMAFVSFPTPGKSADNDTSVRLTLALLKRACENEGGHFEYTFELNEDGSIDRIYAGCHGGTADLTMCTIWEDGDYLCFLTRPEQSIQQQVSQSASTGAALTEKSGTGLPNQSGGGSGTKVESRQPAETAPTPTPVAEAER